MVMTPVELESREFGRTLRGYNSDEVDKFIQRLLKDYEALYRDNQELKDNCEAIRQDLRRYKNLEDSINETLLIAQKAAEDTRNNAVKEAELIIREAKSQANGITDQVQVETQRQQEILEDMVKQQQVFAAEFKLLLMTHLELLEKKVSSSFHEASPEQQEDAEEKTEIM